MAISSRAAGAGLHTVAHTTTHSRTRRWVRRDQPVTPFVWRGLLPVLGLLGLGPLLQKRSATGSRAAAPRPAPQVRAGSRNLLVGPVYGPPDDLKVVKGVAEVPERMLHGIGVCCFWQIADWTPADVAHADAQLQAFKGRIERDQWVTQAGQLAASRQAAQRPGEMAA